MSQPSTNLEEYRADVEARLAEIVLLLSAVSYGDLTGQLAVDLPEDDPMGALYRGINETIASLSEAQRRSDAYQQELEEKLAMLEARRSAMRELSAPIIEVWNGVLCLPVVGVLDSTRSAEMTELLLEAVVEKKARCAIIDITGIEVMDTAIASHFMSM